MTLSKREKFLIELLVVVAVSAAAIVFAIAPLSAKLSARRAEADFKQQQFLVYTKQVENYDKNKQDAQENQSKENQLAAQLSDAKTPEMAENSVVGLFESKGIEVQSAQVEHLKLNNSVGYYEIKVTAVGDFEKLLSVQAVVDNSEYLTMPSIEYKPQKTEGQPNTTATVCVYIKEGD